MAAKPFRRFYIADLVFAALVCGLTLAVFTQPPAPANQVIFIMIGAVVAGWTLFRQRRQAPACEECGRVFIPQTQPVMPGSCPHCGREQLVLSRSIRLLKKIFWGLVGVLVFLLAGMAVLVMRLSSGQATTADSAGMLYVIACWGLVLATLFGVRIYRSILMRHRERACEACGSIIEAELPADWKICPRCQYRHLPREAAKKQQAKGFGLLFITLGILTLCGTLTSLSAGGSGSGMTLWFRLPLLVLGMFIAIFVGIAAIFLLRWKLTLRQLRSERGALAMARKSAAQEGEVVKEGAWSIWYSGQDDPVPMLRDEMEVTHRLFETLLGGTTVAELPFRIFVFHDRGAFIRFHMWAFLGLDFASYDGFCLGHPHRIITLCTAPAPSRMTDPQRTTRSLATYALLESVWGPGPPAWLQSGLSKAVVDCDERGGLTHLNRKMVASLSRGTALSTEIFTFSLNNLFRLMRGSKDPANFQKFLQFHSQAWSIVEYLCGDRAPQSLRMSLGAFLRDPLSKTNQEDSFRLHFGLGFGPLLDGWRQWVLDQGIGTYSSPPDRIREGLLTRVLPVIRDREARYGDRITAIREWADVGYVLGADALINLLREPGDIPKVHIVLALSMVSGLALGDKPDLWEAWWNDLPSAGDEPSKSISMSSDRIVAEPTSSALATPSAAGSAGG